MIGFMHEIGEAAQLRGDLGCVAATPRRFFDQRGDGVALERLQPLPSPQGGGRQGQRRKLSTGCGHKIWGAADGSPSSLSIPASFSARLLAEGKVAPRKPNRLERNQSRRSTWRTGATTCVTHLLWRSWLLRDR